MTPTDHWSPSTFAGKKVLITGHTGFKGSWLALWLTSVGARVGGLALPPDDQSLFVSAAVDEIVASHIGDVRDLETVESALRAESPEIVFHMAAQSLVRRGYASPTDTYSTNVMGTVNVLEAARRIDSIRGIVVVTSDKCYHNPESSIKGLRESDELGGSDPYSSSKACAELVSDAYRTSFFNTSDSALLATARAGNVIGGGDWAEDRLVPDIARALAAGRSVNVRNPKSIRPWQHVLEPLRGYLMLGEKLLEGTQEFAEAWNFGPLPEDELSVEDLVRAMIASWGQGDFTVEVDPNAVPEAGVLRLDTSKAQSLLGYSPLIRIDEAVALTASWYRHDNEFPDDARNLTLQQIDQYHRLVAG